ncbi:MAG TPA: ATP-binding protein [Fulvivirga sp.]|nr:ATP-binding protein [Fulvivirga sp.]
MFYKRFSFKVVLRIALITANSFALSIIFGDDRLFFNQIILFVVLVIQIVELLKFVKHTNRELAKFLLAIKHRDFSINFQKSNLGDSFKELNNAFSEMIEIYKKTKTDQEAQFQYLRMVVSNVNIGIISIEDGLDITLMNKSAEEILKIKGIRNWNIFKEKHPLFSKEIDQIGKEGRKLIELKQHGDSKTLSVDVSSMIMLDKSYKLITLQDIKNEIEQKEIEAWHKLIRILTHEIMNSATPISSLSETMQMMLEHDGKQIALSNLTEDTINDLRFSLQTIRKRSNGMLDFIDDYRKLTKVPTPVKELTNVANLIKEVEVLVKPDLIKKGIQLIVRSELDIALNIDAKLIQQVLLNLIKNAAYAVNESPNPIIRLSVYDIDNKTIIEVSDNGMGIPEKEISEIFIPFYTTKKTGSGIGLSLSKQIMHLHGGTIKVKSIKDEGATFLLSFKN